MSNGGLSRVNSPIRLNACSLQLSSEPQMGAGKITVQTETRIFNSKDTLIVAQNTARRNY
jgi:hypothetical protein